VASDYRHPIADNPPYNKNKFIKQSNNVIRRTPHHGDNPPVGGNPYTSSWSRRAIPGEFLCPVLRAGDPARNCQVAAVPNTLEEPGRRIGQRGDATRAPTQVPRPARAAGCRPSASRDWPQRDKSINSFPTATSSPPPRAIRLRDISSNLERIHPPPYACPSLETGHSADLPLRRPSRPKSRRGWNSSSRTPT
jgi:hypothetical protein